MFIISEMEDGIVDTSKFRFEEIVEKGNFDSDLLRLHGFLVQFHIFHYYIRYFYFVFLKLSSLFSLNGDAKPFSFDFSMDEMSKAPSFLFHYFSWGESSFFQKMNFNSNLFIFSAYWNCWRTSRSLLARTLSPLSIFRSDNSIHSNGKSFFPSAPSPIFLSFLYYFLDSPFCFLIFNCYIPLILFHDTMFLSPSRVSCFLTFFFFFMFRFLFVSFRFFSFVLSEYFSL